MIELKGHKENITAIEINYLNKQMFSVSKDSSIISCNIIYLGDLET